MNRFGRSVYSSRPALAFVLYLLFPNVPMAAETIYAVVERDGDNYLVEFLVRLDAPLGRVRVITDDYERFPTLSPTIIESEVLERRNDGSLRIKVVLRPCVLVFCKRITKTSDAERMAGGEVRYVADSRASDFYAAIEWLWVEPDEGNQDRTRVRYRAHLMPRFFVPPLIGPWLVRRQILHELSVVAERVELLAAPGGKR